MRYAIAVLVTAVACMAIAVAARDGTWVPYATALAGGAAGLISAWVAGALPTSGVLLAETEAENDYYAWADRRLDEMAAEAEEDRIVREYEAYMGGRVLSDRYPTIDPARGRRRED